MIPYAHSARGLPPEKWQTLEDHSRNVAKLAAQFAAPFGSSEAVRLLGWLHDIGKATLEFQEYLERSAAGLKTVRGEVKHAVHSGAYIKPKFHNMSEAVFVFDEIQALPVTGTYLFNSTVNFLAEHANRLTHC